MIVRKRIRGNAQGALRLFLILTVALLLFSGAGISQAQEPDPTQTPSPEASQTPVSVEETEITETASPVETETDVPSISSKDEDLNVPTARILIKISHNAHLTNVMSRMEEYGRVIENKELGKLGVFILEVPENQVEEKISELRNSVWRRIGRARLSSTGIGYFSE